MKKIQRYYHYNQMRHVCRDEDVAELEAKCEKLEAINAGLLEAAEGVVARWDSPLWKDQPHTGAFIDQLRAAIAKAKGEQP
jgi:hypothetical protein